MRESEVRRKIGDKMEDDQEYEAEKIKGKER